MFGVTALMLAAERGHHNLLLLYLAQAAQVHAARLCVSDSHSYMSQSKMLLISLM